MKSVLLNLAIGAVVCLLALLIATYVAGCDPADDYPPPPVVTVAVDAGAPVTTGGTTPVGKPGHGGDLTWTQAALQHCQGVQQFHFTAHPSCTHTYQNEAWLTEAYAYCNTLVSGSPTVCHEKLANWMYAQYQADYTTVPPPPAWYGDRYRWSCANGWPYLSTPNDSEYWHAQFNTCTGI